MRKLLAILSLAFVFAGCGYKPAVHYSKKAIGDKVYAKVTMLRSDPENTLLIKDAINEAVVTKFGSKLASEKEAATKMYIEVASVGLSPIQYDQNGYIVLYRMNVVLNTTVVSKKESKLFQTSGSYDFSVEPNTTVSDSKRFEAIKNGSSKAIDMLISQISILGLIGETGADSSKGD
jgi:hypothetical protein